MIEQGKPSGADMSNQESPCVPRELVKQGRRRFLGAGTAAAPALLTLASQPALGVTCFTPSRNMSRNTSVSQQAKNGDCTGTSVTTYAASTGGAASTTAFHPLFAGDFFYVKNNAQANTAGLRSCTLLEVLKLIGSDPPAGLVWSTSTGIYRAAFVAAPATSVPNTITLAKHIVAAYLNCSASLVPSKVLAATGADPSCTAIWLDFIGDGSYEVMAGVMPWTATDIVAYLTSNGIAPA